ncbi:hypothetical protein Gotur_032297 [Gossypium turneri]
MEKKLGKKFWQTEPRKALSYQSDIKTADWGNVKEIPSQPVHRHQFSWSFCLTQASSMIRVVKSHGWSRKSYGQNRVVIRRWTAKIC